MPELRIEAETWELYRREIQEAIVDEESTSRAREAVNAQLAEVYKALEPLLEAHQRLAIAEGYRQALSAYGLPQVDMKVRGELEAERAWVDEEIKGHGSRIEGLRGRYKNELRHLTMLHALRDKLPAAAEGTVEPP